MIPHLSAENWFALIGLLVTLASFVFALLQRQERKKLEQLTKSHAWMLWDRAGNLHGHIQLAMVDYMETYASQLNPDVIEYLSKSEAFSKELVIEAARQIQIGQGKLTRKIVDRWIRQGRIPKGGHKHLLYALCSDDDEAFDSPPEEDGDVEVQPHWKRRLAEKYNQVPPPKA